MHCFSLESAVGRRARLLYCDGLTLDQMFHDHEMQDMMIALSLSPSEFLRLIEDSLTH